MRTPVTGTAAFPAVWRSRNTRTGGVVFVFGQGCEFDYSGTQACKALREEGYRVILINSNPATIMTNPGRKAKRLESRYRKA